MLYESERIEFKSEAIPNICKSIIAFANTNGGKLYIGINDDGNISKLTNIDNIYTRITNTIRDAILPDITMFIHYTLDEQGFIIIDIAEGSAKPYYLKAKGLKSSGVFVRQGASSVPASQEQIRQFIKLSDGDSYEAMRSLNQELSFSTAQSIFQTNNLEFAESKYFALGLRNIKDNQFTNLAQLISEQCLHSIKVAVFEDNENTKFQAHREFTGSIFQQLENAFAFLMLCNQNPSNFSGLTRNDNWDYPEAAIREALLNAIIHRDYSYSGSIIINVNKQAIEFISLGGLLPGLSLEDIQLGISQPRNAKLAEIFHRLKFIESYGTGIRRIFALYKDSYVKPKITVTQHAFKITLPNLNYNNNHPSIKLVAEKQAPYSYYPNAQQQKVLSYVQEHGKISDEELQVLLDVKRTRAYLIAKEMLDKKLLAVQGRGIKKYYYIP